ncbi:Cof-type HAD-IIB family hydrolase [Paenibacillus sp. L3-i20]|uniref:Cof-type HAD-IIB family hydrolase n=1 Tax=Paenibacillus sp. L3-i20 TaxID=2905833 RepID=UPI001EE0F5C6|nr:Cof-type HAD-IIB family hydrolase [Paenibacillus sp. L3-i20]GKU77901.1 phosphatase [Paenibacillus sp. L3-i20]
MSYKIVFFDIDGTLVNEEKEIPNDTLQAIRELKENGIEPVIATGRAPYFIKPLAEQLGIESYVCLNGGYVVYKGQLLYKRVMDKSSLEALVGLAGEHNHGLVFEGEHNYFRDKDDHPNITEAVLSLKVDFPDYNPNFWQTDEIFQVFLHCESHEEHLYETIKSHFTLIRWHAKAMDVLPLGGSKAQGIEAMLKKLEYSAEDAVAFGDGLNDKEMLEYVGFGVAMGNSHPELLPYANYVTTHVDEKGIRNGLIKAGLLQG